jgi:hypothetical protein
MAARMITVYDPTAPSTVLAAGRAPRLRSFDGKRAGVLDNGKANAGLLLRAIVRELRERHGVEGFVERTKPVAGPASPQVVRDLRDGCDFVLVGSAD